MEGWKEAFVASLGGGLIYQISDSILSSFLGGYAVAGITLKDIALILLTKYGADRTGGMLSLALRGATIIGLYRIVYEQFIARSVAQVTAGLTRLFKSEQTAGKDVTDAARSWIMKAFRSGLYRV